MPLTQEQFQKARDSGFTTEQIVGFEKKRTQEEITTKPQEKFSDIFNPSSYSPQAIGGRLQREGQAIYKEGISPILSGLSTAAFGLPKAIAQKAGVKEAIFPEQETLAGKATRGVAETLGFMGGGAVKIGGKVAGKIGGNLLRNKILKGATEFGIAGALQTPEEDIIAPERRVTQGLIGAFFGGAVPAVSAGVKSATQGIGNVFKKVPFAEKIRTAFFTTKHNAVERFGNDIERLSVENPERIISLKPQIEELIQDIKLNPKLQSTINRTPALKQIVDNPDLANNITLKQSQEIINGLRSKLPATKLQGYNVRPDDIPLFELIDDIKGSQLNAFPEMEGVRKSYGEVLSRYNLIKNKIKQGQLLKNLSTKFGDPELNKAAEDLLNKDTVSEIRNYRNAVKTLKGFGILGGTAIAAGVGGTVAKKIFQNQ